MTTSEIKELYAQHVEHMKKIYGDTESPVSYNTFRKRLHSPAWTIDEAVGTPLFKNKSFKKNKDAGKTSDKGVTTHTEEHKAEEVIKTPKEVKIEMQQITTIPPRKLNIYDHARGLIGIVFLGTLIVRTIQGIICGLQN